jgi:NADP-dependent 3-hydroxy acid dehydrogenase YdfG
MLNAQRGAVVTGAGSGIGRAIALGLAGCGWSVLLVGREEEKLREVATEAGARPLVADIATDAGRAAVAAAAGTSLDVLVHSAGAYLAGSISELADDQWAALDAVNLHAPILLTSRCLNALRNARGSVVFINSSAGILAPGAGKAAYAAGKHGLRAAADALRAEVSPEVRVLSIFPGRTDTPMQRAVLREERRTAPPGTLLAPEDVAAMVLAALSLDASAEVTEIVMRPRRRL